MDSKPLVSVIVPVYNGARYLHEAVESLRSQTLAEIEIIAVNDGSTDETPLILDKLAACDARLRVIHQLKSGIAVAMEQAIQIANGNYIARMDADDIAQKDRLEVQYNFMKKTPQTGLCGTWAQTFGDGVVPTRIEWPCAWDELVSWFVFNFSFCNPTLMMTRQVATDPRIRFDRSVGSADDYAFAVDVSRHYRIVNIPKVLLRYRKHPSQVTNREHASQVAFADEIRRRQLAFLGVHADQDDLQTHNSLGQWNISKGWDYVERVAGWLERLMACNRAGDIFPKLAFEKVLGLYWLATCQRNAQYGLRIRERFYQSELSTTYAQSFREKLRFLATCLRKR